MCGIAGLVRLDRAPIHDAAALAASLEAVLAHRGPDGHGTWASHDGDVLMVHTRLAIIDPGPSGAQPMATADGRYHIVYNGEVYNFRELRRDLESRGERFESTSDTEVLLRLLTVDGPQALARVRGMFALACWDTSERALLVARDRFGIKPLYLAVTPDSIAFASELSALSATRLVGGEPSVCGVAAFLSWGSIPPPLSWLRGADILAQGTWRLWRSDRTERRGVFADAREAYRSSAAQSRSERSEREWRDEVGLAVRQSVEAHLVADVPVGVFLSGGIDSGAIVSAARSGGAAALETFTVGFDDTSSEAERARNVARAFETRHHEIQVDSRRIAGDLPHIVDRLDQPTIDAVNSYCVAKAVAATGIKAVLSGAGGDELFGGYPSFRRMPRAVAAKRLAGPLWPMLSGIGGAVIPERLRARWQHFARSNGSLIEAYRVQRGFLLPEEIAAIAGPRLRDPAVRRETTERLQAVEDSLLAPAGNETPYATVARLESRLYLQSQLLRDIDAVAMAHGLEVRVPLVDQPLASTVWPELGRHPSLMAGKRLLHETLQKPLPQAIVQHPKQGFTLPFAIWMNGDLGPVVRDGLERLANGGWIAPTAPSRVWTDWTTGRTHWSRPWGLAVLGHFLDRRAS
ncbi:MAG TPA: asparagine synthase (glutamine-hydrolyzing) [Vicinamibacterales bacterium]|nr:asparagine synthase (glutamine-hydrolyzing) [Vicinamibacterales bacterium]